MATIYQNIFAGTDGGPWPDFTPVEGSHNLLSGKGRQATAATASDRAKAYYNVPSIPQDFVLTVDVTIQAGTTTDWYVLLAVRGGSNSFNNAWIYSSWQIAYNRSISGPQLYNVNSSGTYTWKTTFTDPACVVGDTLHLKIAPLGTTFRFKSWKNAAAEPASYETFVDAGAPTGTRVMLGCAQGLTASPALDLRWDDLLIVDTTTVTGTLARTLGPVTSVAFGSSATVLGTLAETLDNTVVQAVGGHGVAGTVARSLANATSNASGATSGTGVTGTLAVTLEGVEVGSPLTDDAGNPITDGVGLQILDQNGLPILDENGLPILDTGGNPILVRGAEGTHTVSAGSGLAVTLGNVTVAAFGQVGANVTGSLARTLGNVTSAAVGTQGAVGALARILDNATLATAGTVSVVGTAARTLGNVTAASSGTSTPPGAAGNVAVTLANVTSAASGSSVSGIVGVTLAAVTGTGAGTASEAPVFGTATVVTADTTGTGQGVHGVTGTVNVTLAAVTATSSGGGVTGSLAETLENVRSAGVGSGSFSDFRAVTVRERGHQVTVRERRYAVAVREWN